MLLLLGIPSREGSRSARITSFPSVHRSALIKPVSGLVSLRRIARNEAFASSHRRLTANAFLRELKVPSFSARIPQIGTLIFEMAEQTVKGWQAESERGQLGISEDDGQVFLLRGRYRVRGKENAKRYPFAATLFVKEDGEAKLLINLKAKTRRGTRGLFLDISIDNPFASASSRRTKLDRATSSQAGELGCDPEEELDLQPHSDEIEGSSRALEVRTDVTEELFQEVEVFTIADGFLHDRLGEDTNALLAARVNAANVLYAEQLGIILTVSGQHVFDASTDPYIRTTVGFDLLNNFSFDVAPSSLFPPADLYHLFTGRDFDGSMYGLAWRGKVCSLANTSISQYVSNGTLGSFLLAHELGHNLGATHDLEDTYVMSPRVSYETTQFSTTSKIAIASNLQSKECIDSIYAHVPEAPANETPTPEPEPELVTQEAVRAQLEENIGKLAILRGKRLDDRFARSVLQDMQSFLEVGVVGQRMNGTNNRAVARATKAIQKALRVRRIPSRSFKKRVKGVQKAFKNLLKSLS